MSVVEKLVDGLKIHIQLGKVNQWILYQKI